MNSKQITFSDIEYGNRKRITKREEFLDIMDEIISWDELVEFVRPYYPSGKRGRPVKGIETMLRMYLLQNRFNLSDEGIEDAVYDSYAFRKFMKIDFVNEQVPDATTVGGFKEFEIFNMRDNRMECEANLFAAQISLSDEDFLEFAEREYDTQQIARTLNSDINLVALKADTLISQGYRLHQQEHCS